MNEDPCGFGYETLKRLHTVACAGFFRMGCRFAEWGGGAHTTVSNTCFTFERTLPEMDGLKGAKLDPCRSFRKVNCFVYLQ